jgi:hypothetical protein
MNDNFPVRLIRTTFWLAPFWMFVSDLSGLIIGSQSFWISTHFFWLSFYTFLGLIFGMVQLLNYSPYSVISGLIAAFGALIGITIIGMSRFAWGVEMEGISRDVIIAADSNPWVFFTSRFLGITFPIGLIMLVIGLKRHYFINTYLLVGLIVSILLFPLGRIPKELILNVAGDALMVIFFGMVGKIYLKKMNSILEHTAYG